MDQNNKENAPSAILGTLINSAELHSYKFQLTIIKYDNYKVGYTT